MVDELKRQTAKLDHDVVGLTREIHHLNRRNRWVTAALYAIAAALIAVVAFVAYRAERTATEQEQLRSDVLCPLYGLILGSYDPDSRAPGAARDKYEQSYKVFRDGYRTLRCAPEQIVPPRTDK